MNQGESKTSLEETSAGQRTAGAVTSKDGTSIAYDQAGSGPVLILIDGATQYRAVDQGRGELVKRLAPYFTVISYDRRGRGESGNTLPFAVEREIEDIEALIDRAGGAAFLHGMSSGAALAFEAALKLGGKVKGLAMYEAPYNSDPAAQQAWREYARKLDELLADGRLGDAFALFLGIVGVPQADIEGMRQMPMWPAFEAVAPTLAYDQKALGDTAAVPAARAARLTTSTLVMNGSASYPFMHESAVALAKALPNGQHRMLADQTHDVSPAALAPALVEFFTGQQVD